jgi:hypothetical protein
MGRQRKASISATARIRRTARAIRALYDPVLIEPIPRWLKTVARRIARVDAPRDPAAKEAPDERLKK